MSQDLEFIRKAYAAVLPDCEAFYKRAPLNEFWGGHNLAQMRAIINGAKDLQELVHGAQRTMMFSVNVDDESEAKAVRWLLEERCERVYGFIEAASLRESEYTLPALTVPHFMDRGPLTPDFLRCVNIVCEIRAGFGSGLDVVELGGGLGHLARVLKATEVAKRYTIIDLPETLVFSYAFLRLNFPEAQIAVVQESQQTVLDADITLVPVAYAESFLKYNPRNGTLFLNTASMGEMRNETVRYWMSFIQEQLQPSYLFTLNRFLNTITPALMWRTSENECQQHYDRHWTIEDWQLEPSWTRCPFVDTRVSRYVAIRANRLKWNGALEPSRAKVMAAEYLDQVRGEDWWRLRQNGHVMGMRDNPLIIDGGTTGALFKMWNAIRLNPTAEAVDMMLHYLDRLCRREHERFEEEPYYRSLLRTLVLQEKIGARP